MLEIEKLHKEWIKLGEKYCSDTFMLESLWKTIQKKYSGKKRHYHNLFHIQSMLIQAEANKDALTDLDLVLFAIWFHDVIYKSSKKNNEEKSAEFGKAVLSKFSLNQDEVKKVVDLIVSTKAHQLQVFDDLDNAFLLDFDLSILGQGWNVYETYIKNIRKEYSIYPDFLYNPGRKKVLKNFLGRETLFFTEKYQDLYEAKARKNLKREIIGLL